MPTPPLELPPEQRAGVLRDYEAGERIAVIAERWGCSPYMVRETARRAGFEIRPAGGRKGKRNPLFGTTGRSWRGGRVPQPNGYVQVWVCDDDPMAVMRHGNRRYVFEHRLVMARHLGRPLVADESVHHINGDRADNRLENLQLRVGAHGAGVALGCMDCGSHRIGPVPIAESEAP